MDVHTIIFEMGITCFILFLSGLLASKMRLSLIPLYILAGLVLARVVRPNMVLEFMAEIGVILLLFVIGLEFSFGSFIKNKERFLAGGFLDLVFNLPLGFLAGQALGLDIITSLFLAGIVYISSSAIIGKSIVDLDRAAFPETEYLLGILVFEDIFIALYIAALSGIVTLGEPNMLHVGIALFKALGFCISFVLVSIILKKYLEVLLDVESTEIFVLLIFSLIMITSSCARFLGLSEAIGAFFAGMVVSETRQKSRTLEVINPFYYLTTAIFFVSFGMITDYSAFGGIYWWVLILVGLSIPFKLLTGLLAGRSYGLSRRASIRMGLSLLPRGEFSIVLAAVAMPFTVHSIQALTTLYVLIMAVLGSILIKMADVLARWVDRPNPP
jgi:CPA2 family monovalent cation:H+ antiporter-2